MEIPSLVLAAQCSPGRPGLRAALGPPGREPLLPGPHPDRLAYHPASPQPSAGPNPHTRQSRNQLLRLSAPSFALDAALLSEGLALSGLFPR